MLGKLLDTLTLANFIAGARNRRIAVVTLAASLFCTMISRAEATLFLPGDFGTHLQDDWGYAPSAAGILLDSRFNTLYGAAGYVEVGIPGTSGNSMFFTSPSAVFTYLPAGNAPAPLSADLVDPTSTASGIFGAEVLALRFNIDFADAGFLLGNTGIPVGDLTLYGLSLPGLNGLTVRAFQDVANTALGGGSTPFAIADLSVLAQDINAAFSFGCLSFDSLGNCLSEGHIVTQFAQDHLQIGPGPTPVPEPTTLSLLGIGAAALTTRRFRRNG